MLEFVRDLSIRIRFDRNKHKAAQSVDKSLPHQFNIEFAAIETLGDGNCAYNAVSIALIGSEVLNGVLRLLSLSMALKYREEFERHRDPWDRRTDYLRFLFGIGVPTLLEPIAAAHYSSWTTGILTKLHCFILKIKDSS